MPILTAEEGKLLLVRLHFDGRRGIIPSFVLISTREEGQAVLSLLFSPVSTPGGGIPPLAPSVGPVQRIPLLRSSPFRNQEARRPFFLRCQTLPPLHLAPFRRQRMSSLGSPRFNPRRTGNPTRLAHFDGRIDPPVCARFDARGGTFPSSSRLAPTRRHGWRLISLVAAGQVT